MLVVHFMIKLDKNGFLDSTYVKVPEKDDLMPSNQSVGGSEEIYT